MKRRTLDIIFSVGGVLLAALLLVLGLVLQNQADFAKSYVKDQLVAAADHLHPGRQADRRGEAGDLPRRPTRGQPLTTGKQAECYANKYIALHLAEVNDGQDLLRDQHRRRGPRRPPADAATKAGAAGRRRP